MKFTGHFATLWVVALVSLLFRQPAARAGDDENNEYQLNLNPQLRLSDQFSAFGNFGYYRDPDNSSKYRFGLPGLIWSARPRLQFWGGLDSYYTDNFDKSNTLELRPFGGIKLFAGTPTTFQFYSFTRYEYRAIENLDTHEWDNYSRIRSRFGVEFPLTSRTRAWQEKTFYGFTDGEPFYRFDTHEWDQVRVRGGLGCVLNDRIRMELIYTAQFTRSSSGSSLEHTDNILQLNIKIALQKGILARLFNPGD